MALKSSKSRIRFWYSFVKYTFILFIICFVFWFLYGKTWRIQNFDIIGFKHTDKELIKNTILENFNFPDNHLFLYRKNKLEKSIRDKIPTIENVNISIINKLSRDRGMIFDIKDRVAFAVYCDLGNICYFYDEKGIIFKKSYDYKGNIYLKFNDLRNNDVIVGDKIPCSDMCLNKGFKDYLLSKDILSVDFDDEKMIMKDKDNLIYKALLDINQTYKNMQVFYGDYKGNATEYVDLRFKSKIFYR